MNMKDQKEFERNMRMKQQLEERVMAQKREQMQQGRGPFFQPPGQMKKPEGFQPPGQAVAASVRQNEQVTKTLETPMQKSSAQHPLMKAVNKINESRRPLNVGDLNRTIWPFFFTFKTGELAPDRTLQTSFTVTQEAAFIWLSYTKAVFLKDPATGAMNFIDPQEPTKALGEANGLEIVFRDAQSTRVFNAKPMALDHVGWSRNPSVLSTPTMFLPNSTVEAIFSNKDASRTYVPFVTFFGYRVRIEDAQSILSTITG